MTTLSSMALLLYLISVTLLSLAESFKAAIGKIEWDQEMLEEIEALEKQGTWSLVLCPNDKNVVGRKWICKVNEGTKKGWLLRVLVKLKVWTVMRLLVIVRHSILRIILALAAMNN